MGKVPNKDWEEASFLAKELHGWRRERLGGLQSSQPPPRRAPSTSSSPPPVTLIGRMAAAAAAGSGSGGGRGAPLFGSDVVFNFDLDVRGEDDEYDELDRAFPGDGGGAGAGGGGVGAFGGFAFDSFDSFVGNDGSGARQPQPVKGEEEKKQHDRAEQEEKEGHGRPRQKEGGGAAPTRAAAGDASFPASSGKARTASLAAAAADTVDAGWLYSRCVYSPPGISFSISVYLSICLRMTRDKMFFCQRANK